MNKGDEDDDSFPADSVPWLDTVGVGAMAAVSAGVFALSIFVLVLLNEVAGALTGDAVVLEQDGITFEAPELSIVPTLDQPAWLLNAAPFDAPPQMPVMAVVVLDDGARSSLALNALEWDAPLSFAVAADFDASPYRVQQIRRAGREVLALVPFGYGPEFGRAPNVLRRGLSEAELLRRLHWHLARAGRGIVGVIDQYTEDIARDDHALQVIGDGLVSSGMLMIDSRSNPDSLISARLRSMGVPVGRRITHVGHEDSIDQAFAALTDAERQAFSWGTAIILVDAGETSMQALSEWLETRSTSIALAPVSHVVRRLRTGLQQAMR